MIYFLLLFCLVFILEFCLVYWKRNVWCFTTLYNKTSKNRTQHLNFRQMRNRDAAVRSRERKKEYVKNIEMKSRYLEGECRRLGHLLRCCYAENHALRLCLQSGTAFGAPMTKLESAVLLLGKAYIPS